MARPKSTNTAAYFFDIPSSQGDQPTNIEITNPPNKRNDMFRWCPDGTRIRFRNDESYEGVYRKETNIITGQDGQEYSSITQFADERGGAHMNGLEHCWLFINDSWVKAKTYRDSVA